jgi:DnaJ-class molecular chaperone
MSYYDILQVDQKASAEEIKKAFRKLALQHHPDKETGNKDAFQNIQEAYETLSDPQKRSKYDLSFADPFVQGSFVYETVKKNDYMYLYKITLEDVYNGTNKKLKVSRVVSCTTCGSFCHQCNGMGGRTQHIRMGIFSQTLHQTCHACGGSGKKYNLVNCAKCSNQRKVLESDVIQISLPKGVTNGKKFVYEGWGEQAVKKNEQSGAFIVVVEVESHSLFTRRDNDLIMNVDITLKESFVGKQLDIPHFGGSIQLNTDGFGIINPDLQYTIYNKGLRDADNNHGHLHLKFKVIYPKGNVSDTDLQTLRNAFDKVNME